MIAWNNVTEGSYLVYRFSYPANSSMHYDMYIAEVVNINQECIYMGDIYGTGAKTSVRYNPNINAVKMPSSEAWLNACNYYWVANISEEEFKSLGGDLVLKKYFPEEFIWNIRCIVIRKKIQIPITINYFWYQMIQKK